MALDNILSILLNVEREGAMYSVQWMTVAILVLRLERHIILGRGMHWILQITAVSEWLFPISF